MLPMVPPTMSIAGRMIEDWAAGAQTEGAASS